MAITLAKAIAAANQKDYSHLIDLLSSIEKFESTKELMVLGAAYKSFGFISEAMTVYKRVLKLKPGEFNARAMLASVYQDFGDHRSCYQAYHALRCDLPNNTIIWSNFLLAQQWHPHITQYEIKRAAEEWGSWLINKVGERPRPFVPSIESRKLRVGYLSADFCQHTVGLLVKDVILSHSEAVEVYCYSATRVDDWVGKELAESTNFKDIRALNDSQLADVIISDGIDVLVDLSGHTAGTRISVFAYRPAPILVSWLGYFSTTGLKYFDAIILDKWHVSSDLDLMEPIICLESGRITYTPVPWMPLKVPQPPCLKNQYITFGCFNNTNKLNSSVFDAWAKILLQVPKSKLVLKWRTFNDQAFKKKIIKEFASRGVAEDRVECRQPSYHKGLLSEYGDIDIALDPFPFSGGLTSLEALYLGRPVVTLPRESIVSRQTYAFLCAIDETKLVASSVDDYVKIAVSLAFNGDRLFSLNQSLRSKMQASPIMSSSLKALELERVYHSLLDNLK
ncbi:MULTISPECIES: hypothetical protein [unclassified Marinobacterium]|jgi:predicted O-linked N-acetylglucosamine transferase (SPINDLY family)|uniref:O-linked N-acetylglucosamine transferase, SPINDLY family protein n=1 Tax=unclassified Marinobacterium TaxID=2644139 RepID=UPI0015696ED2|nr:MULTISPECIES: hypothetical protein [unclassified Marinobacterium]NRP46026.1 hypothetical protein [Marinobacterium sp. xm-d-543]NRQ22362.1 hypothetical protein [Marinobacterium sp. xm-m-312]